MSVEIKLNELRTIIGPLSYPISSDEVTDEVGSVELRFADGSERLGDVLDRSTADRFETVGDLEAELYNNLPTRAVGEPGQSEGEG